MENLSENWVFEGHLDFEYKKYLLLAYVQRCKEHFKESKLYPPLGELVQHYRNLNDLQENFKNLSSTFPKEFSGFDFNKLQLLYEQQNESNEVIATIHEIVDFALPNIQHMLEEGKEIYEFVETHIDMNPVGVIPVYNKEGYLLINEERQADVHIYHFHHGLISTTAGHDTMHSLQLRYLFMESKSMANSFENIKAGLIRKFKNLPQPATYLCMSKMSFPLFETLLPVTKRMLLKKLFTV